VAEHELVGQLIDASSRARFGELYGQAVEDHHRAEITQQLLSILELKVTGWLPVPMTADSAIGAIHDRVARCYRRAEDLLGINLVILEHLARATVGLSEFLTVLSEEEVCLYAAVLLNAAQAPAEPPNPVIETAETAPDLVVYEIDEAAFCAGSGDPAGWQQHVARALEIDPAAADRAARAALADRLRRQEIQAGMVTEIANGAYRLAAAVQDGPFACPMYLLELVIRRSLAEPGCVDHVDQAEVVYAAAQACGLLDLSAVLLPPGWGWAVHAPLSPAGP